MVRLKAIFMFLTLLYGLNFNSSMVRLKVLWLTDLPTLIKFQFQYGTIKRPIDDFKKIFDNQAFSEIKYRKFLIKNRLTAKV